MSGSNRDEGHPRRGENTPEPWLFPLVGIIAAIGIAWFVGTVQGSEHVRRHAAPHQHGEVAKGRAIEHCDGKEGSLVAECIREQIEAAEETARSEQDLTAQQQAAWGSMFGAIWGGLALLVTAVGTALLYEQIKLTRKAVQDTGDATNEMRESNRLARETWEVEHRPIMMFDRYEVTLPYADFGGMFPHPAQKSAQITPYWKNIGTTPAVVAGTTGFCFSQLKWRSEKEVAEWLHDITIDEEQYDVVPIGETTTRTGNLLDLFWFEVRDGDFFTAKEAFCLFGIRYKSAIGGHQCWETWRVLRLDPTFKNVDEFSLKGWKTRPVIAELTQWNRMT